MLVSIVIFFTTFLFSLVFLRLWLPFAKKKNFIGKDVQKPNKPKIPEMGGVVVIFGLLLAFILFIFSQLFYKKINFFEIKNFLAVFLSVAVISFIGINDDIKDLGQKKKVLLSLLAGIPISFLLLVNKNLKTNIFFGLNLKNFYIVLAPFIISGTSNAFNMLAGFNGLESGLMSLISLTLGIIAWHNSQSFIAFILFSFFSTSLALWWFNKYPSKVFVGDTGLMSAGAILAIVAMLGKMELPVLVVFIPYFIDFFIKLPHKLPKTFGIYKNGKLYAPKDGPKGLGQIVMKLFNGISEKNLTYVLLAFELVFCITAIFLFY